MLRAAIYARYSSDLQSESSIDDQVRVARQRAEILGADVVEVCTDYALTGATRTRPGLEQLLAGAKAGRFDVVIAEALDRVSRDQEDVAHVYKRLRHAGVALETISEGRVDELHVGLKGTMNALFLRDMAQKVRRGQAGRAAQGRAVGLAYGYEVVKEIGADGELTRGLRRIVPDQADVVRRIVPDQADVVRRIYEAYVEGVSPRRIARELNDEGIPSPTGGKWSPASFLGHRLRRTGILCNDIYAGRLVWNVVAYSRDPDTGMRTERINPESEWTQREVPELAIVSPELWARAQERRGRQARRGGEESGRQRRPKRLLSGLVSCGVCGGSMIVVDKNHLGCGTHRANNGCSNSRSLSIARLERRVVATLQDELLRPEVIEPAIEELRRVIETGRAQRRCGERAREALAALIGDAPATCVSDGTRSFDRYVAVCFNAAGQDLGAEMVRQGWALAHPRYGADYLGEEAEAEAAHAGAHAGTFQTPWDWRKAH